MTLRRRDRVRIPGEPLSVHVVAVDDNDLGEVAIAYERRDGSQGSVVMTREGYTALAPIRCTGGGDCRKVIAGLYAYWLLHAEVSISSAALVSTSLRAYPHQQEAVYGSMLPQPILRFLLADEPGTGKTVMTGMYIKEMRRADRLGKVLLVVPAHLVPKWERDLRRFFDLEAARITSEMARYPGTLRPDQDIWVVSVDLLARNPQVQHKCLTAWDLVVVDEAHRITPTAQNAFPAVKALSQRSTHLLMLTATPHRGSEYFFRALLHLIDSDLYPWAVEDARQLEQTSTRLKPVPMHFLRRMKEDLVDYDRSTPLFTKRRAHNLTVDLGSSEQQLYDAALDYCSTFVADSTGLARSIYGKRGASGLFALQQTLLRRLEKIGRDPCARGRNVAPLTPDVSLGEYEDSDDLERAEIERLVNDAPSTDPGQEHKEATNLLAKIADLLRDKSFVPEKLRVLESEVIRPYGIAPGGQEQLLVFTEFEDTANWLAQLLRIRGFEVEVYAGAVPQEARDRIQQDFLDHKFQILVSTDAGNEGIDLQSAHVQVNWDIPWSLVRLEQRMGRLHRIGQRHPVDVYNLIAQNTREGRVQKVLLNRILAVANAFEGKVFDSLGTILDRLGVDYTALMQESFQGEQRAADALRVAADLNPESVRAVVIEQYELSKSLASPTDSLAAADRLMADRLEAINPAIVGAAVRAIAEASGWDVAEPHADVLRLDARSGRLPAYLGSRPSTTLALSGDALSVARKEGAELRDALVLGPTEPQYRALLTQALRDCGDDLYQGTVVVDSSTLSPYELTVLEATMVLDEAGRTRERKVPLLVKHDQLGARVVSWHTIANLITRNDAGRNMQLGGGVTLEAETVARAHLERKIAEARKLIEAEIQDILYQLDVLEDRVAETFADRPEGQRHYGLKTLKKVVAQRRAAARRMVAVSDRGIKLVGRLCVMPPIAESGTRSALNFDSENVAMRMCADDLAGEYEVVDVHKDGMGFDLLAISRSRPRQIRCVEVKGRAQGIEEGVFLEASEWLTALQLRDQYWLYVVHNCLTEPRIFGRFQDPANVFSRSQRSIHRYLIPASALRKAVDGGVK